MKKQLLFTTFLLFSVCTSAQIYDDFENGTINSWTNTDGSNSMLTSETHPTSVDANLGNHYLSKTCDGSNSVLGEMAFQYNFNVVNNEGFLWGEHWGTTYELHVKNDNSFPLYLRVGIKGNNNAILVTAEPVVVPAFTDWTYVTIGTYYLHPINGSPYGNFHTIDTGDYDPNVNPSQSFLYQTLSNVSEFRIIHNTNISFDGEIATGTLQVDNVFTFIPLSVKEDFLTQIRVFPNPVVAQLHINFPHKTKGTLTLTAVDGKQLLSQELTSEQMQLDLSKIKSKGIYFLKIETASGTLTKKIVKS